MCARLGKKPIKIWNFWENFKIYIQKFQWKRDFYPFLSHIPGPQETLYTEELTQISTLFFKSLTFRWLIEFLVNFADFSDLPLKSLTSQTGMNPGYQKGCCCMGFRRSSHVEFFYFCLVSTVIVRKWNASATDT